MDGVQPLVLEDQPAAPLEQAGLAAQPRQPVAVDRPRRDGVDLDFRAEMPRHRFDHRPLSGLRHGIVGAVGVTHREELLAAEVARDVEDIARPLLLHQRDDEVHQRIVGYQIGVLRVAPGVDRHVDRHLLGPRHPGVVDEVIDPAERPERRIDGAAQTLHVGDVDTAKRLHPALDARETDVLEFGNDPRLGGVELAVAPRHHHHLGPGQRQQPRHLPADARRPAGDQRHLAEVQPHDVLGGPRQRALGAGRLLDRVGQVEVDRVDPALLQHDPRRLARREQQAFGLGIGVADDLVAPFLVGAAAMGVIDDRFVAPDPGQFLRCAARSIEA